jgi:hypothetical protein
MRLQPGSTNITVTNHFSVAFAAGPYLTTLRPVHPESLLEVISSVQTTPNPNPGLSLIGTL